MKKPIVTLPWQGVRGNEYHGPYITSQAGNTIADFYTMSHPRELSTANGGRSKPLPFMHEMADDHMEFAVRCVNNHDALVEALEKAREYVGPHGEGWNMNAGELLKEIDAVLAKAKGGDNEQA